MKELYESKGKSSLKELLKQENSTLADEQLIFAHEDLAILIFYTGAKTNMNYNLIPTNLPQLLNILIRQNLINNQ